jgi:hypothetical protein
VCNLVFCVVMLVFRIRHVTCFSSWATILLPHAWMELDKLSCMSCNQFPPFFMVPLTPFSSENVEASTHALLESETHLNFK